MHTAALEHPFERPPSASAHPAVSPLREPLIDGNKSYHQVTEDICKPLEGAPTPVWYLSFVAAVAALILERSLARASRSLSRFQDYALPVVIAVPFVSGFLVMHPPLNPFSFHATLLVHVVSADIVLILAPLTKISHCVLLPLTQVVSEVAWHFPPDAGSKVAAALGKEGEPI